MTGFSLWGRGEAWETAAGGAQDEDDGPDRLLADRALGRRPHDSADAPDRDAIHTEVRWTLFDFLVAGALLFGTAAAYEVAVRVTPNRTYHAAAAIALLTGLVLIWVNLAVGIIGNENNPANLMYAGVLAVGLLGTLIARLEPKRMMWVLLATALAQALVAAIALLAGLGAEGPLSILFAAPWLLSAWLFRRAGALKQAA